MVKFKIYRESGGARLEASIKWAREAEIKPCPFRIYLGGIIYEGSLNIRSCVRVRLPEAVLNALGDRRELWCIARIRNDRVDLYECLILKKNRGVSNDG